MNAKRRRKRRRGNGLLIFGLVLMLAAGIFAGFNMVEDSLAGEAAGSALEQLLLAERDARDAARRNPPESAEETETGGLTFDPVYLDESGAAFEGEIIEIDGYPYMGVLQIPKLDITLPMIAQWSYAGAQIAPCRYSGSVEDGGLVIAGHNFDSHFGRLSQLEIGDEVKFIDLSGNTITYAVAETEVLDATAIDEMVSGGWDLTLFTCTLSGETRFTVRCSLSAGS